MAMRDCLNETFEHKRRIGRNLARGKEKFSFSEFMKNGD